MRSLGKRIGQLVLSILPFLIIGVLFGAALLIKPKATGKSIDAPAINRRDTFFGIAVPEKGTIWAAGNDGKVIRSDDNGNTWKVQATSVEAHFQDIAAWNAERAVAVGNQGVVIITKDGGRTWRNVEAPRSRVANKLMRVRIFPEGVAWAVGEMGAVLVSRDYGETWERRAKEEDVGWNDIAFADSRNGWIVGEKGRMLHTNDGGTNWTLARSPSQSSLMAVAFRDRVNGVAVGLEGGVLKTRDGGRLWVREDKVTNEHLCDVTWDGAAWRVVGTKGTLLTGDPSGSGWKSGRLSDRDLAWHTKVVARFGALYVSGATTGCFQNGKWNIYRSRSRG